MKNASGIGRQLLCTVGAKTRYLDSKARVLAHPSLVLTESWLVEGTLA